MTFRPYPTRSGLISLGAAIVFAALAMYSLTVLFSRQPPAQMFWSLLGVLAALALALLAVYWTNSAFNLRYYLDRNGLIIYWGLAQQAVPFEHIRQIIPGSTLTGDATFRGVNLAGLRAGSGRHPEIGALRYRTTAPLADSTLVITKTGGYVISPQQPQKFMAAWQSRQPLGPTRQWAERTRRPWPFSNPLLADRLAWGLLGGGLLLLLALLGYIALNYVDFPGALPVHFNNLGRADRIAPKIFLLVLPTVGATVWLFNLLLGSLIYPREKVGARLLWGSTVLLLLCMWVALFTITGA